MAGQALLDFLLRLQKECGGTIPFERYMQEALYDPQFGYYSSQIRNVGAEGDFSTSASLDTGLGPALAAWISAKARQLGWSRIPLIEIGAGSGSLAHSILRNLDWKIRWRTRYMIHETSPALRKRQQQLLRWQGVRWIDSLGEALKQSGGRALIFSNELADAFPCRLFERRGGGWEELGVKITDEGDLSEISLGEIPFDPWFHGFGSLPEGQRVERCDSFRNWLHNWREHWKEGVMLTIDYGDLAERIYARKPEGSLRAYWRHQRLSGREIYAKFGKQDLTADVNFSDLIRWGEKMGWTHRALITQREFVKTWLPENKHHFLCERFSIPGEAGDAFKVLEQGTPGV